MSFDNELDKKSIELDKLEKSNKFEKALQQEDCDVVDSMLVEGHIPDPRSINIACANGNVGLLQTLLKYDMHVQAGLFTAVRYRQTHLLNYLFLAGADINCIDKDGGTILHIVRDKETCKWLLNMGAKQIPNSSGMTLLLQLCQIRNHGINENIEMIQLILSRDPDSLLQLTSLGCTPLNLTCHHGNVDVVKLLLSYEQGVQSINIPDKKGNTCLLVACYLGYLDVVKLLLSYEQGVQSINQANKTGSTPFYAAYNHPKITALLTQAQDQGQV